MSHQKPSINNYNIQYSWYCDKMKLKMYPYTDKDSKFYKKMTHETFQPIYKHYIFMRKLNSDYTSNEFLRAFTDHIRNGNSAANDKSVFELSMHLEVFHEISKELPSISSKLKRTLRG